MQVQKICNLCGTCSEETAIFSCNYAKGDLNICLGCLSEGIFEIKQAMQKPRQPTTAHIDPEVFDLNIPDEVYGFNCEGCSEIMFTNSFPVQCESCQHINHEVVLQKQVKNK